MGDQWLQPVLKLVVRRDRGDTLPLRFLLRLLQSIPSSSSIISLHGWLSPITPLATLPTFGFVPSAVYVLLTWDSRRTVANGVCAY